MASRETPKKKYPERSRFDQKLTNAKAQNELNSALSNQNVKNRSIIK
jgi:hypothetical protein